MSPTPAVVIKGKTLYSSANMTSQSRHALQTHKTMPHSLHGTSAKAPPSTFRNSHTAMPPFIVGRGTHHTPMPHSKFIKNYQDRAIEYGYSDGFVNAKQIVTVFLISVLRAWKAVASHRADVRRRELLLRACWKLRRLSIVFYHWLSKSPPIAHRTRVWTSRVYGDLAAFVKIQDDAYQ